MKISTVKDVIEQPDMRDSPGQSEIRYRRLFEATHDGIFILDSVSRKITDANPFMVHLLGYPLEELLGKELWEIGLLKDEQASHAAFQELQRKGHVRYDDLPLETKAGDKREVDIVANRYDEDGTQVIQCNIRDNTERKRTDEALRLSEEGYRALFASVPMAVFVCDRNAVIQHYNLRAVELWGREPTCGVEQHCGATRLWLPDGTLLPHAQSPVVEVLRTGIAAQNVEVFIERPDGTRVPVLVNFAALRNAHGEITGAITSFVDITARKQAEERQRLLLDELAHRGGNLLAVIQSIVSRSLTGTRPLDEERETLAGRLLALSRTHSALTSEGLDAPVDAIIRHEFEAFSNRVTAVGPGVILNARAAQTFALLVHELATNAAKYGALSRPKKGHVDIQWSIEGAGRQARFKFRWQERDGPPVIPPTRQGFGSVLLEKVVAQEFDAQPKISFAPEGVSYELDAALSVMTPP